MNQDWDQLWTQYAASAEQNPAQALRRWLVVKALDLTPGSRLLDIGSGQGDLAQDLSTLESELEIVGLDISASGIAESARKVPGGRFFQVDLMKPIELREKLDGWATHAVCTELLEHVPEPERVLVNTRPLMALGSRLVVTVPSGPMSAFDKHIGHLHHYRADELRRLLEGAGYQVEAIWRAGFPFFNLYRLTVILRGKRLIQDATSDKPLPWSARFAMKVFGFLFRFNAIRLGPGWQLVALARLPRE